MRKFNSDAAEIAVLLVIGATILGALGFVIYLVWKHDWHFGLFLTLSIALAPLAGCIFSTREDE